MSAILTKYPLAEKALQHQESLAPYLGGKPSALFRQVVENYARTADSFMDEAHEDTEAVIIGCILLNGSPMVFEDLTSFMTEYTPQVAAMVDTITRLDERAVRTNVAMQQALAVIGICHNQAIADILGRSDQWPQGLSTTLTKADLWQPQHYPLLEESAPRLYAAFERKCDQLLAAIDTHPSQNTNIVQFKAPKFDF